MHPHTALGFFNIGGYEWLIILIIALLLFGRRLPEVMRGLGGGVREFRKGIDGSADESAPLADTKPAPRLDQTEQRPQQKLDQGEPVKPAGADDDAERS